MNLTKAVILLFLFMLCSWRQMRHGIVPRENSVEQTITALSRQRGKYIYEKDCMSCHGVRGLGNGALAKKQKRKPANLQKLAQEVGNFKFFMATSELEGKMPGWKDVYTDQESEDLTNYIKSFR